MNFDKDHPNIYWKRVTIPKGLPGILESLAKEAMRENPDNLIPFLCKVVDDLIAKREREELLEKGAGDSGANPESSGVSQVSLTKVSKLESTKRKSEEENPLLEKETPKPQRYTTEVDEELAASKIQAGFRGYQTRKLLKESKGGGSPLTSLTPLQQQALEEVLSKADDKKDADDDTALTNNAEDDEAIAAELKTPLETIREESIDGSLRIKTPEVVEVVDKPVAVDTNLSEQPILEDEGETSAALNDGETDNPQESEEKELPEESLQECDLKKESEEPVVAEEISDTLVVSKELSYEEQTIDSLGSLNRSSDKDEQLSEAEIIGETDIETLVEGTDAKKEDLEVQDEVLSAENASVETDNVNNDNENAPMSEVVVAASAIALEEPLRGTETPEIIVDEALDEEVPEEECQPIETIVPVRKRIVRLSYREDSEEEKDAVVIEASQEETTEEDKTGIKTPPSSPSNFPDGEKVDEASTPKEEQVIIKTPEPEISENKEIEATNNNDSEQVNVENSVLDEEAEQVDTLEESPSPKLKETEPATPEPVNEISATLEETKDTPEGTSEEIPENPEEVPDNPEEIPEKPEEVPDNPEEIPEKPEEVPDNPEEIPEKPEEVLDSPDEIPEKSTDPNESTEKVDISLQDNLADISKPEDPLSSFQNEEPIQSPDCDKPDLSVTIPVSNLLTETESLTNTDSVSSSTTTTVRALASDKNVDSSQDASSLPESETPPPVPKPRSPKPTSSSPVPEMESPKRQRIEPQEDTSAENRDESAEAVSELPVKRRQRSSQKSRSSASKYRSGLVMDDEVSMEEMEAQIENEMLSQAATKIQAGFRGYKTRKSFRQSGVSKNAEVADSAAVAEACPPEPLSLNATETTEITTETADETADTNIAQQLPVSDASVAFSEETSFLSRRSHEGSCPPETTSSSNSKPSLGFLRSRSYPGSAEGDALIEADEHHEPLPDVEYDPDYINNAATVIQATVRGFLVRKRNGINKRNKREVVNRNDSGEYEDLANPDEPEFQGLLINPADRDSLSPVSDVDSDKAATKIQAAFRGYKDRKKVRQTKKAVVTIQATVRGFLARRRLARSMRRRSMQRRRSSAKLMSQEIQKMQKVNDAATKIQAVYRGYQVRSKIRKNPNDE